MSMPVSVYCCTKCDFRQQSDTLWGLYEYLFPNGVRLPMKTSIGWCEDCSRIVRKENFDPYREIASEEIGHDIDTFPERPARHWWDLHLYVFSWIWRKQKQSWQRDVFHHDMSLADRADIQLLIGMRTSPKCLECGSTNVISFSNGNEHLHCGGQILKKPFVTPGGFEVSISHQEATDIYSIDGLYIRTDAIDGLSVPAYLYEHFYMLENAKIRGIPIPPGAEKL